MSIEIPLEAIPNQSFSIRLDAHRYVLTIKEMGDVMAVTIERDSVVLVSNMRAVAGTPLLPYPYLSQEFGNFIFTNTDPEAIPYYTDFATTCKLVYSTAAEIAAAVNGGV